MGLVARGAQDVYLPGSCSEGQVLDEQSGFCVPKELETAEEQPQAAEESQPEQPEQQSSDDEGDGLDDNSNGDGDN